MPSWWYWFKRWYWCDTEWYSHVIRERYRHVGTRFADPSKPAEVLCRGKKAGEFSGDSEKLSWVDRKRECFLCRGNYFRRGESRDWGTLQWDAREVWRTSKHPWWCFRWARNSTASLLDDERVLSAALLIGGDVARVGQEGEVATGNSVLAGRLPLMAALLKPLVYLESNIIFKHVHKKIGKE